MFHSYSGGNNKALTIPSNSKQYDYPQTVVFLYGSYATIGAPFVCTIHARRNGPNGAWNNDVYYQSSSGEPISVSVDNTALTITFPYVFASGAYSVRYTG